MKEEKEIILEYIDEELRELRRIVPKGFFVYYAGSSWASIEKKILGLLPIPVPGARTMIHFSIRHIDVRDKRLYDVLKNFGERNNYDEISKNYL